MIPRDKRPTTRPPPAATVLVVDDDDALTATLAAALESAGFDATIASNGREALDRFMERAFEVVVSDIEMPGMSGVDLLTAVRALDPDAPFILLTGNPTLETAMEAVAYGALQYLVKPTPTETLVRAVTRASQLRGIARLQREAVRRATGPRVEDLRGLTAAFDRTLESLWIAFQPIIDATRDHVFAYEALMRSREPELPNPIAILEAAEKLDRLPDLGRRVRDLATSAFAAAPAESLLFVNLHTKDLLDVELYDEASPLRRIAPRVVLEITERATLDHVADLRARLDALRAMGFRVAIDDLGAGYAGLTSFVAIEPDLVKLDMALVRGIDASPIQQRLVSSLIGVCRDMRIGVVAEGIETAAEGSRVRELGCSLLQGYFFARPGPPFPAVTAPPPS